MGSKFPPFSLFFNGNRELERTTPLVATSRDSSPAKARTKEVPVLAAREETGACGGRIFFFVQAWTHAGRGLAS